jgi:hypothetical protein
LTWQYRYRNRKGLIFQLQVEKTLKKYMNTQVLGTLLFALQPRFINVHNSGSNTNRGGTPRAETLRLPIASPGESR